MSEKTAKNDVKTNDKTSPNDVKSNETVEATVISTEPVNKEEVRKRKSGRITEVFVFNEANVTRGRYEQFVDLPSMIEHFIESYDGKPIKDFYKIIKRANKQPYESLRIPKAVQEACYTKLKAFMVIKEIDISARKKQYYVEEVYDRQFIKDGQKIASPV